MIHLYLMMQLFAAVTPQQQPNFEAQVVDSNVSIGYGLAIGDVDGDRKPDILLADKKQFVWYRNGDWKRFVMIENLTASDNVCIAARDIDGDGRVEVAVGAQWNPGETTDTTKSGSVHYLIRPKDPTQLWPPVQLHHEPTVHRMRWVKTGKNSFNLVMLPLHGRGNKNGEGKGVRVIAYTPPKNAKDQWTHQVIDESMHLTHNFDIVPNGDSELLYIGGKEGIQVFSYTNGKWSSYNRPVWLTQGGGLGEVRVAAEKKFIAGVEPMHGNSLAVYNPGRTILTDDLNQGHALAVGDLLKQGDDQVVIGWREPNKQNKVGIKMFVYDNNKWVNFWIDDNGMACEDLQIADLNGDGKKDIIAAGRASHNLKIYWNKSY
jgi:hypothetical protein